MNIGFRLEYGSWKIGCTRWRKSLVSARLSDEMSLPSKRISPLVGSTTFSSIRAVVVLPEPDSPTIATVSPRGIASDTSSTATKSSPRPRTGYTLVRFSISTMLSRSASPLRARPASAAASARPRRGTPRAAGARAATDGAAATSDCVYGCCGVLEDLPRRSLLHDLAAVHHDDPLGALGRETQVVRDEQHRRAELARHRADLVEDRAAAP